MGRLIDRENVISRFKNYLNRVGAYRKDCSKGCDACMALHPNDDYCDIQLLDNVLTLLKEQEAVEPEVEVLNEIDRLYRCPRCHKHFFYEKQKYCDQCGQAVKWE